MDETSPPGQAAPESTGSDRAAEVFGAFLQQGVTAFGGPAAQIAQFQREFVERRGWLSDAAFADLLAMAQFLPGQAASQLSMAIGLRRAGLAGLLAAWMGFALPAALVMTALGVFAPAWLEAPMADGAIHGLKIAAAAVVAQAVVRMARSLAVGPIRAGMAIGAAAGLFLAHGPVAQILALAAGAVFGLAFLQEPPAVPPDEPGPTPVSTGLSLAALGVFAVLLAALPFLAAWLNDPTVGMASVFFRTGTLSLGDGQAVLPLLHSEVVGRGWMDLDTFLAGYGAAQALPGGLFGFAGFVGAAQGAAPGAWAGGAAAVLAIFAPSLLLVLGVTPFWDQLKRRPAARGAMAGVHAVMVGLLAAALWNPVLTSAIERPSDWLVATGAFVFLAVARLPAWLVVIGFAAAMGLFHPIQL